MPKRPWLALSILLLAFALVGGVRLGANPQLLPEPLRDALVGDDDSAIVRDAIGEIRDTYYRDVPASELQDKAIAGMVDGLKDEFSAYFPPAEYAKFKQAQNSEFEGVGLTVAEHPRGLRVIEVYDKSPAERGGVKPGDLIVAVNGRSLRGQDQDKSVAMIKGPPGTDVTLTTARDGRTTDRELTRATIDVPVVASRVRTFGDFKYLQVRLAQFASGAHAEMYQAIQEGLAKGAKGIVFDLRANGGGLVSEAQLVASAFLPDGEIVTTRGRNVPTRTLNATGDPIAGKTPTVVLVDRDTASASEIVAGALQDRDRAKVVGTRTFGKGVFQEIVELDNGGALDITAGQYFTPKGRNLGGKGTARGDGLAPDVEAKDDRKTGKDEALLAALRELRGEL